MSGQSLDLFSEDSNRPGDLGCRIEIAATMAEALERARIDRGLSRSQIADRMSFRLGQKFSETTLDGYCAPAHADREPTISRAMAFDAALGEDILLNLYARKRGDRRVVTREESAYIELGRIAQEEKALAERKRALTIMLKNGAKP